MCGIVGYIGHQDAQSILLASLERLEYRGYDSSGMATLQVNDNLHSTQIRRKAGKLKELRAVVAREPCLGHVGIGHTRWATHGKPTDHNAHPHHSNGITVVHNGIIENHQILRQELIQKGYAFNSDTDTEVVAHLIADNRKQGMSFVDAVSAARQRLQGAYALLILDETSPDHMICLKYVSPLVLGMGDGEMFVASDFSALLAYTKRFTILEDGDMAVVTRDGASIFDQSNSHVNRPSKTIEWSASMAEKNGHKHFMHKEIHEQSRVITDTIHNSMDGISNTVLSKVDRLVLIGCGSSYHAGLIGKYYIEDLAGIPVDVELASEFRYRRPVLNERSLVLGISQSGETIDTLFALSYAKNVGAPIVGLCNVVDSAIARLCEKEAGVLYTRAGPEIGVASTKAFIAQTVSLYMLALHIAKLRNSMDEAQLLAHQSALDTLPRLLDVLLLEEEKIKQIARVYTHARSMLFLGRGYLYPMALEGALKMKEISYVHAEGYAAGEMKHGPIALIDENLPVILLAQPGLLHDKITANLEEVKARGARIIGLSNANDYKMPQQCDAHIQVPVSTAELEPILISVALQLLAYHVADIRGTDVDQPRNLAKSVTVE